MAKKQKLLKTLARAAKVAHRKSIRPTHVVAAMLVAGAAIKISEKLKEE